MAASVVHHAKDQEFTIEREGHSAELAYSLPAAGILDFTHTFVDKPLRGKGLAEELARAGLAFARQEGLRVRTSCPFMGEFVARNPEYASLLESASEG